MMDYQLSVMEQTFTGTNCIQGILVSTAPDTRDFKAWHDLKLIPINEFKN